MNSFGQTAFDTEAQVLAIDADKALTYSSKTIYELV